MKAYSIIFTAYVSTLISCHEPVMPKPQIAGAINKSLVIGNPLDCGIDNFLIFPVGTNYNPAIYDSEESRSKGNDNSSKELKISMNSSGILNDRYASQEYINDDENEFDIRNILFYDQNTGATYPLVKDTVHILSFALHKEFVNPLIFYRIVKKDINKDTIFNSKDPVILFVSDMYGKNLTQITPDDQQFTDYFYYASTNKILIKATIDGNKDKHFAMGDETNFTEMNIKAPAMGREIFSKSLKDSLRLQ